MLSLLPASCSAAPAPLPRILLSPDETAALDAITGHGERKLQKAWRPVAQVGTPETVETLAFCELIEIWDHPVEGPVATLTPWGAYRLGYALAEVWEHGTDPQTGDSTSTERPVWVEATDPRVGRILPTPRYGGFLPLIFPDRVPDRRPSPKQLVDEFDRPVTMLGGYPVAVENGSGWADATRLKMQSPPPASQITAKAG